MYYGEVASKFEHGIADTPYAWHGTSVEAIALLAELGSLPTSGAYGAEFFYAPEHLNPGNQEAFAKAFAAESAEKAFILGQLDFTPTDMRAFKSMLAEDEDTEGVFLAEARRHGLDKEGLRRLRKQAKARKGVLLGISPQIAVDFTENYPEDQDERSVLVPQGISLAYITGIEPLGSYEWDELINIQERAALEQ